MLGAQKLERYSNPILLYLLNYFRRNKFRQLDNYGPNEQGENR